MKRRRTGLAPLGASFIYTLLSKNAVNWEFLRFSKYEVLPSPSDKKAVINFLLCLGEWALSMVGVEEGREFRFGGDLYSQESIFPLVYECPLR